ncbi:hypothetical protein MRX96_001527 [Rhipicephalus microplus]
MICSNASVEYIEDFSAADPDRIGHSPPPQVVESASVSHLEIPSPELSQWMLPSHSSMSEDVEVLTPIAPGTSEPYQTMCTIVNNTSSPAVAFLNTTCARHTSPEATDSTMSQSAVEGLLPDHKLR